MILHASLSRNMKDIQNFICLKIQWVSGDVNLGQYLDVINGQHFQSSDRIRKIYIAFGLKPQDLSHCHKSDATCFGGTVWDEKFNMDSPRVQQSFLVNYWRYFSNVKFFKLSLIIISSHKLFVFKYYPPSFFI